MTHADAPIFTRLRSRRRFRAGAVFMSRDRDRMARTGDKGAEMTSLKPSACLLIAGAFVAAASGSAVSQTAEGEYGVRMGSFIMTPELTLQGRYSDNYLELTSNEADSFIYTVAPRLSFRSDWNRHALEVTFGGQADFVEANSNDNAYAYGVDAAGVIDITRAAALKLSGGYQRAEEERSADDAPGLASETTEYDTVSAGIEGRYKAGMVRLSPFADYTLSDYDDVDLVGGGLSNADDRDRQRFGYGLEVGYEFMRGYEAFVRGEGNAIRYDDARDDNGFERDSNGYRATAGVNFALTRLIEGRLGVGYGVQDYDDPRFGSQEDVALDIGLDWSVTPLTMVNLEGFQRFNETTTIGSAGTSERGGKLSVSHSLRENITLTAFGGYSNEQFEGVVREDNRVETGVGVDIQLVRHLTLGAGYRFTYEDQKSIGDLTENEVFLGLTARY